MLPKVNKILFATDLSANADQAMRHALGLAQAMDAQVDVLHVTEELSNDAIVTLNMFMQDKSARSKAIEERHGAIRDMLKKNQKAVRNGLGDGDRAAYDRVNSVELVEGHPAEVILRRAKDLKCDMIVMGTHEHGTGQTFLGTIAKRVLRRTNIPTLIVPNN